ncbi:MAG: group II truncated hemoglobin [Sphingomonadales bacterium]|nr:group II truncated hemoglobin [Sphingomonadales bacterium]
MTAQTADAPAPPSPFDRLGGADSIRAIVERFYDLMDSDPAYAELRAMHAADLAPMRVSLAGFLTGWAGGPRDWFAANPGRCMMSIHRHLAITPQVAQQWADAMQRAIADISPGDPVLAKAMAGVLGDLAGGMAG